jgi:diaminopimelate epimerase
VHFWKYQGSGNDFIIVDRRGDGDLTSEQSRVMCNRHTGIGADGVLACLDGSNAALHMRVFNADGSRADMCGNGLRCFVRWAVDVLGAPADQSMSVSTDAGDQDCLPIMGANGDVDTVRVNLGSPRFLEPEPASIAVDGAVYEGRALFLGNPHFVIQGSPEPGVLTGHGPSLSTHSHFPQGTNVEWLNVTSRSSADVVVYERGVGPTQACGTGGAGAAVTGVRLGLLDGDTDLTIRQPGGKLIYRVARDYTAVWMTGPAAFVFKGEIS